MRFPFPAVFGAPVGQYSQQRQILFDEQWQNPIIEQIRCGDRGLGRVQLGTGHLGIGIDKGLLIDPSHALQGADVERILAAEIARVGGFNLTTGFIVQPFLLQARLPGPQSESDPLRQPWLPVLSDGA